VGRGGVGLPPPPPPPTPYGATDLGGLRPHHYQVFVVTLGSKE